MERHNDPDDISDEAFENANRELKHAKEIAETSGDKWKEMRLVRVLEHRVKCLKVKHNMVGVYAERVRDIKLITALIHDWLKANPIKQ